MTIIEMAREMGKVIQQSDEYKALMEARTASDNDEELQKQIGEFNLVRMKMEIESGKPEPDQNKINELNEQLMSIYTQVMESENMVAFNKAKDVVDHLMNHVTAILTAAVNGEDPDTYEIPTSPCDESPDSSAGLVFSIAGRRKYC